MHGTSAIFRTEIPVAQCHKSERYDLLYFGISPSAPPANGKPPESVHYGGNTEGSTPIPGMLLSEHLGIELRRAGSGKRLKFGDE